MKNRILEALAIFVCTLMAGCVIVLFVLVITTPRPSKPDNRPVCGWNYKAVSVKPIIYKWVPVRCDLALKNP